MTTAEKLLPQDTRTALQSLLIKDCSRSLYFDRFSRPDLDKDSRKQFFTDGFGAHRSSVRAENWATAMCLDPVQPIFAQLQGRLMVNMAGGVMENAGLCLDRFGMPYIPGSAVKGCARRMAIQELLEAREAAKPANELAQLLASIALAFGWGEEDWSDQKKDGRFKSDFAYAVSGGLWLDILRECGQLLLGKETESAKDFGHVAGRISFLPAHVVDIKMGKAEGLSTDVPALGKLELDVVTCHHGDYYKSENPNAIATDTEDPVPVFFPAVAAGHIFAFALRPLRGADDLLVARARTWLASGLASFGIGAKTAAGYGWFGDVTGAVRAQLAAEMALRKKEADRKAADEKAAADAKAKADAKAALDAELAGLSPEQRADKLVQLLTAQQFEAKIRAFCKEPKKGGPSEDDKKAIVRALRGPQLSFWETFKTKATKGDLATVDQAIRQLSKQMFPGKDGKMP
jgi:CRISPR/Cas system CMR subunit Cmr6 (Cas7 group RAMP superfamily)